MNENVFIRTMYAPGCSFMTFSFYRTNLSIRFALWTGRDGRGFSKYDTKNPLSTTINDESVASLYVLSKAIIEGKQKNPIQYVIECNNNTKLTFEYRPNENNQMRTYLSIEKNGKTIPFEFAVQQFKERENGQVVVKEIQSGLKVFSEIMTAYLSAIGADRQLMQYEEGNQGSETRGFSWD